jgi:hypothetical protein
MFADERCARFCFHRLAEKLDAFTPDFSVALLVVLVDGHHARTIACESPNKSWGFAASGDFNAVQGPPANLTTILWDSGMPDFSYRKMLCRYSKFFENPHF